MSSPLGANSRSPSSAELLSQAVLSALQRVQAGLLTKSGGGGGQEGLAPLGEFLASKDVPEMKT